MDNDRVRKTIPAVKVMVAGVEFDNVFYDVEADVLYLHVGDPSAAGGFCGPPAGPPGRPVPPSAALAGARPCGPRRCGGGTGSRAGAPKAAPASRRSPGS